MNFEDGGRRKCTSIHREEGIEKMGQGEREDAALIGGMWPMTEECQQSLETGSDKEQICPQSLWRERGLPNTFIFLSQNTDFGQERINLVYDKSPIV